MTYLFMHVNLISHNKKISTVKKGMEVYVCVCDRDWSRLVRDIPIVRAKKSKPEGTTL